MPEFQAGPGLLLVFAELGEKVTEEQFHGESRVLSHATSTVLSALDCRI
jgi:hypothetical protein